MKTAFRQFVIGLFLVLAVSLNACGGQSAGSPEVESPPALREGLTMAWVDGSNLYSLIYGSKWMWASLTAVTNNMYSLCIQAGDCTLPAGSQEAGDFLDPTRGNQPLRIVGPDKNISAEQAAAYCGWIGGRVPTDEEAEDMAAKSDPNGNPLYAGDDGALRCVVENPRPMAIYCENSPYYDPALPIEYMNHAVVQKETFCQNGRSYVTFDIAMEAEDTLQSVIPQGEGADCQVVDGNRIVCGGPANTSTTVIAGLVCDSRLGIKEFSVYGLLDGNIAGILDGNWVLNSNGVPVPTNGTKYPGDVGRSSRFTPKFAFINGVMVALSVPGNGIPGNGAQGNGSSNNGSPSNGLGGNGVPPPVCPPGYYYDNETMTCNSVAPPNETTCIDGFTLNPSNSCCKVSTPNGNYPGCPGDQMFDPLTGLCDSQTTLVGPGSLRYTQSFNVAFPVCSAGAPGDFGPEGGNAPSCPAGQTYTCEPVCGCAPG